MLPIQLKVDPWAPERGGSFDTADLEPVMTGGPVVNAKVETADAWTPRGGAPAATAETPQWLFIDGTRRIDQTLFLEQDGRLVGRALIGSAVVGAALTGVGGRVLTEQMKQRHLLVTGVASGTQIAPQAVLTLSGQGWQREYTTVPAEGQSLEHLQAQLQTLMRNLETQLAIELRLNHPTALVCVDGPLSPGHNIDHAIGLIKRQSAQYLGPAEAAVLGRLQMHQRTPVFHLGSQPGRQGRLSWYVALTKRTPGMGIWAGLMRCEVQDSVGAARAIVLADETAAWLPRFASLAGTDPRAPQNLLPIGALERAMTHALGDRRLIQRALLSALDSFAA